MQAASCARKLKISWKLGLPFLPKLEKSVPPIFGSRQAAISGSRAGELGPPASWNFVGASHRGSGKLEKSNI